MTIAPRPKFVRNSSQVIVLVLNPALFFFVTAVAKTVYQFVVASFACQFATEIFAVLLCKDGVFP